MMSSNSKISPIQIYAGTAYDVALVKNLFIQAGIEIFLKDEILGTLGAWQSKPGRSGMVKVSVLPKDYNRARKVIKAFERVEIQ